MSLRQARPVSGDPRLLIFEPDRLGHVAEWLDHIASYLPCHPQASEVTFVVAREMAAALGQSGVARVANLRIEPLGRLEQRLCTHPWLVVSGLSRWFTMCRWLRRTNANHGVFLGIDHASLALGLRLPGARGRTLSGILFRPSVHYRNIDGVSQNASEWLRDMRKRLLYPLMLRHPALVRLHSLDPYFVSYASETYRHGTKVAALPDPVTVEEPASNAAAEPFRTVPPGRTTFVLFGVLTERKGVLAVLDALALLDSAMAKRIALIMAGELDPAIRRDVGRLLARLTREKPELSLHLEDRRISIDELGALLRQADVVLAPYQRFVGSSGVLGWAARMGRPVLTQDYGLLGRVSREYGLGVATDCTNPRKLAQAIQRMAVQGTSELHNPAGQEAFLTGRSPDRFAAAIVGAAVCAVRKPAHQAETMAVPAESRDDHRPPPHEHVRATGQSPS